ncbi:MAG: CPBP family intramembrane metalloprotease [Actinomycetota bacterium]|nr:CPBP family intramembrane metalloprotease [Actinomycetota bacterium]
MGPNFVRLAALFYGALAVAAALWNGLRGRGFQMGDSIPGSLLLGLLAAAATVALGLALYGLVPAMRRIAGELAPHLVDRMSRSDLVLISVFSGVGEELFFRGAVQPEFGLTVAALAFGLVHVGPDRRYLVWTAWAVLAGFLFGFLYRFSGGLLAPVVAHTLHNAAMFLIWKRSRKGKSDGELPAAGAGQG